MTRIILMRHGESEANRNHMFAGRDTDVPLSPLGRLQADAAAEYVAKTYQVDCLLTSPLSRAKSTCMALADLLGKTPVTDPALVEIYGGEWEGKTVVELIEKYGTDYLTWRRTIGISHCTNGESFAEVAERAVRRIREIAQEKEGQTVFCATHAAFIRAACCVFGGTPVAEAHTLPWPGNASVSVIEFEGDKARLVLYGHNEYLAELAPAVQDEVAPYPMRLSFIPIERIWGGDRLVRAYGKDTFARPLGETWELAVRPDVESRILNGAFCGITLTEALSRLGFAAVSPTWDGGRFPLLVKLIDATDKLSLQVHPDDARGMADGDMGKTEMWYILDAEPGAEIVYGLADGVDADRFAEAVKDKKTESVLRRIPVKKGDVFFIPSGLVHAIGAGIVIAEIQQNSDLTYRVYDYDRRDANGRLRALHIDKALDVIRSYTDEEIHAIRYARTGEEIPEFLLADSPYFRVEKKAVHEGEDALLTVGKTFVFFLCTEGGGTLSCDGIFYPFCKGQSWFLPAGIPEIHISGEAEFLLSSI